MAWVSRLPWSASGSGVGGMARVLVSTRAESRNEAASTSSTPRTSRNGSSAAASSGPNASAQLEPKPTAEFAVSRSRPETIAGMAERDAGWKTCEAIARSATRVSSSGSGGSASAISSTSTPCTSSQMIITRRRSNRSLMAPVSGLISDGTKSPTSSSSATARPCPVVLATCSIRATMLSESPP